MIDFLQIVYVVIGSLVTLSPFLWLLGSLIVCACAIFGIRFILWR